MIKRYNFDYDYHEANVMIEVDTNVFTEKEAKNLLDFFTWDFDEEENPIDEYMKKLAIKCIEIATFNNYNAYGVLTEFDEEMEGWPKLDGTYGIKLIDVSAYEFCERKFDINIEEDVDPLELPTPKY